MTERKVKSKIEWNGKQGGKKKKVLIRIKIFFDEYSPLSSTSLLPSSCFSQISPWSAYSISHVSHGPPYRNKPDATHTHKHRKKTRQDKERGRP